MAGDVDVTLTLAGMGVVRLSDVVAARLDVISFFLVGFFLSALVVKWLWNSLRNEWTALPVMSYRSAFLGTFLWGVVSMLVLTMISGARELLTPGAWEKEGWTYRLSDQAHASGDHLTSAWPSLEMRRARLAELRTFLWTAAAAHAGRFPTKREEVGIATELWQMPGTGPTEYGYRGGATIGDEPTVLAFEWPLYDENPPLELMTDGSIRFRPDDATPPAPPASTAPKGGSHE